MWVSALRGLLFLQLGNTIHPFFSPLCVYMAVSNENDIISSADITNDKCNEWDSNPPIVCLPVSINHLVLPLVLLFP